MDDEDVPELVSVTQDDPAIQRVTAEVEDLQVTKVPITIITGR